MRFALISLLGLVALCRSDLLLPFSLSNDLINYTAQLEQPSSNGSICNVAQLNYCQYLFNQNFGLNSSVSYDQGSDIFSTIQDYLNSNVTQLNKVCKARTNFYHCLGHSYYSCMNLHTRLESNNTDSSNRFDYIRTFRGLEWVCGGGFREVINQYNCVENFTTTNAYQSCITSFNQSVSTNNFCPSIQQAGDCLNRVYRNGCDNLEAGHYGCESFRYTFYKACPGLKCAMGNNTLVA
ncbi:unnamed protein product [Caenorhabditis nigoni]